MPERYSPLTQFDRHTVSEALKTPATTTRDVAHGDGHTLSVADGKAVLEVYPDVQVARVTTAHARVEIYRVPGYTVNPHVGLVVFEQDANDHRTRLLVNHEGKVSFHPVLRVPHAPQTADTPPDDADTRLPLPDAAATATAFTERLSQPGTATPPAEPDVVVVQGRLGHDPWFGSKDDQPIARVALAHNDRATGTTTWYNVSVTGELVDQLRQRGKGDEFRLSGTLEKPPKGARTRKPTFLATEIIFVAPPPKKQPPRQ